MAAVTRYTAALGLRDADAVTSAATFLRGDAARAWSAREALLQAQNEAVNLSALRECLIARFTPAATEHTARTQLDRLRQRGEFARLAAYVVEFDRLSSLIPSLSGSEQAHRFAAGLQPAMAARVCISALTGERHTEYAPMRAAALHAATFDAETLTAIGPSAPFVLSKTVVEAGLHLSPWHSVALERRASATAFTENVPFICRYLQLRPSATGRFSRNG